MSAGDRDTLTNAEIEHIQAAIMRTDDPWYSLEKAVESIVAARVRAAQAQAWDKSCDFHYRDGNPLPNYGPGPCDENPYRLDAGDEFQNPED